MTNVLRASDVVPSPIALLARGDAPHSDRAVRRGLLVPVMRGVYAERDAWRSLKPWDRYLARVHAAAMKYPDAVFCHESAAALRGLTVFLEPRDVHLALPMGATSRVVSGVRIHAVQRMPRVDEIGGLVVATCAETVVDIARTRHNAVGLAVACSAMRADPTLTAEEFAALSASRPSTRGRRHARWVFDRATATPESPLECVSLAAIEWLGFPTPELQKWIVDPIGPDADRLDFWWEAWRIAGEADGELKYSGELGDARAALRDRSRRDARLIDRGVSATAHWGWSDAIATKPLRAALLAAGLPAERPEDTFQLRSMQRALTPRTATMQ
ncbi:hypothetical protein MK786_15610 [Microbacterium sp. CFH 31415]|uniref:type IV toxin-antitoxin system AbiEi family antitoxin domain-containing protein n=1 Tax=Microbacterium sp. CFH 31415 TaxID=2921732 RepID=UPI001F1407D9|nr:hypothetical protein [Microbacterium sp. CFH 31415]MCH6232179.1 hypothetical protein [Microbacterium sp. CFH 31415]